MPDFKIMPHSLEAEQAVLGSVIIDNMCQTEILTMLRPNDFYSEAHKSIFDAMIKIFNRNTPIDFVTLTEELERTKKLEAVGGVDYIMFLSNVVPSAVNFQYHCDIVKANSIRRMLIKSGQNIIEKAYTDESKDEVLSFAESEVFGISEKQETSALEHIGRPNGALKEVVDKFDKIAKDPNAIRGIPTGFKDLDAITNGLQKSDLILLAARPAVGKTSFAMNVITNIARAGYTCAVFSLEMPKTQLAQRALCSIAKVPMQKALNGKMQAEEWKRIWTATKELENTKLFIDDSSITTPATLLSKCRRLKAKEGKLDAIMVDYLQLMKGEGNSSKEGRQNEVSAISRNLKIAAKELNVPIIVLSQLSRDIEKRDGHRPQLSDLRDSGAIEQDADIVMFLHNPEKYNDIPAQDDPGKVELILAKHRNGQTGSVNLRWVGEYTTFVNYTDKVKIEDKNRGDDIPQEVALSEIESVDLFDDNN